MRQAPTRIAALLALIVFAGAGAVRAQSAAEPAKDASASDQQLKVPAAAPPSTVKTTIERWFDVQTASLMARYRRVETTAGLVASNHLQDSIALKARFKFDAKGKYAINTGIATGTNFTGGWNNTGWGAGGDRVMQIYVKQLFLSAAPVKGLEMSAGGIGVVRGESTEITSYDNDGYLMGERVSLKRPADLFVDEISFTNAYLGDITNPDVFARFQRLDEPNYRQLLVAKRFAKWMAASGDYTHLSGVGTVRAAISVKATPIRVIDLVRYEEYRRLGAKGAYGFSAYLEKAVLKPWTVGAGYADIDPNYGGLNADRFNKGRRWFAQSSVKVMRDLSASLFVTHAVNNAFAVSNQTRVDVVVTYNVLGPIQRAGLFKVSGR